MDPDTKAGIVRAGIAAPSADNSQPWRFAWCGDDLDVRIDATRSGRVSDTRYVLSDLAAGACVENMVIRARSLGFVADVQAFPASDDELWIARMGWRRDAAEDPFGALARVIEQRHTDRRFPWRGPISAETRTHLDAQAQTISGARLWWPRSPHERRAAIGMIRQAESLRFKSPSLHAEMFSSIRFDSGWRAACDEGLAPAALAVEPPLQPIIRALRRASVMRTFNRFGAASMLGWRSAWLPLRLSPALCLLTVASAARSDVFAGGRALQRVWLKATLEGLSVQPYATAGVLGLGFVPVEAPFQPQLAHVRAMLGELCAPDCGLVFLRLGRARSVSRYRSGRRAPGSFGDA